MSRRPALVKLGGSLLTGKKEGSGFQRPAARRLLGEIRKAEVPTVLLHGAGSQGHPEAQSHRLGEVRLGGKQAALAVSQTLAAVQLLHAQVVETATVVGLNALSITLQGVRSEAGTLTNLPGAQVAQALDEGFLPVLHGTVVRDDRLGWRVASADEVLAELAHELDSRLCLFATDVDGVYQGDPEEPGARPMPKVTPHDIIPVDPHADATGGMAGKLNRAFQAAHSAPTLILNGQERNRLLDALKGKSIVCTRVEPS